MTLTAPLVAALTAGVLIMTQMVLMLSVAGARRRTGQSLGDGGKPELERAIRRHGNFAENAAIFVAALALLELVGGSRLYVGGAAALFVLGRVSHLIGLSLPRSVNPWRVAGVVATTVAGMAVGVRLILITAPLLLR